MGNIVYSEKYWRNLILVLAHCSILHHHEHCTRVYQGALLSSRLKYLNKAVSQIYKEYYNLPEGYGSSELLKLVGKILAIIGHRNKSL